MSALERSMSISVCRFLALLFGALALTMTSAHLLELPQKMQYGPAMYSAVNTTLYRYFAIVGGSYTVLGILSAAALAFFTRNRPSAFRWTVAGFVGLALAFISWLLLVQPVNNRIAAAVAVSPDSVAALWQTLRDRWEFGHATGFVLQLLGFSALLVSVLIETPAMSGARSGSGSPA
jgi:hypothetical protein